MRTKKKEAMFALVEQWQESDQTQQAFAAAHNISRPCFSYWRAKYMASKSHEDSPSGFIAVSPTDTLSSEGKVEMVFPNGVRILFHEVNVSLMRSLLI